MQAIHVARSGSVFIGGEQQRRATPSSPPRSADLPYAPRRRSPTPQAPPRSSPPRAAAAPIASLEARPTTIEALLQSAATIAAGTPREKRNIASHMSSLLGGFWIGEASRRARMRGLGGGSASQTFSGRAAAAAAAPDQAALNAAQRQVLETARSLQNLSQAASVAPPAFCRVLSPDAPRGTPLTLRRDVFGLVALAQAVARNSVSALLSTVPAAMLSTVPGGGRGARTADDEHFVALAVAMANGGQWSRGSSLADAISEAHLCVDLNAPESGAAALTSRCIFRALHLAKLSAALHDALRSPVESRAGYAADTEHAVRLSPYSVSPAAAKLAAASVAAGRKSPRSAPQLVVTFAAALSDAVGEYSVIADQTDAAAAALNSLGHPLPMLALCVIARTLQLEMGAVQAHLESQRVVLTVRAALRAFSDCVWEKEQSRDTVHRQSAMSIRWPSSCTDAAARLREAIALNAVPAAQRAVLSPRAAAWLSAGVAASSAADSALALDWVQVLEQCAALDATRATSSRPHDIAAQLASALLPLRECAACMTLLAAIEHSPITIHASGFSSALLSSSLLTLRDGADLDELASSPIKSFRGRQGQEALSLPRAIDLAAGVHRSASTQKLADFLEAARIILRMCTAIGKRDCSAGYAALGAAAQRSIVTLHPSIELEVNAAAVVITDMAVRAELTDAIRELPPPYMIGAPDLPAVAPPPHVATPEEARKAEAAAARKADIGSKLIILDKSQSPAVWRDAVVDRSSHISVGRFHVNMVGGGEAWVNLPSPEARLKEASIAVLPTKQLRQLAAAAAFAKRAGALSEAETAATAAGSAALKQLIEAVERHRRVCASPHANALLRSAMLLAALRKSVRAANYDQLAKLIGAVPDQDRPNGPLQHHDGLIPRVFDDIALLRTRLEHRDLTVDLRRALRHGRAAVVGGGGRRSESREANALRRHTPFGTGSSPHALTIEDASPGSGASGFGSPSTVNIAPTDPSIELDGATLDVVHLLAALRFAEACGFVDFVSDRGSSDATSSPRSSPTRSPGAALDVLSRSSAVAEWTASDVNSSGGSARGNSSSSVTTRAEWDCIPGLDDDWTLFFMGLSTPGAYGKKQALIEQTRLRDALQRIALEQPSQKTASEDAALVAAVARHYNGGRWLITSRGATEADPRLLELIHSARCVLPVRRAQEQGRWTEALALSRTAIAQQPIGYPAQYLSAATAAATQRKTRTSPLTTTANSAVTTTMAKDDDEDSDFATNIDPGSIAELACAVTHARRVVIETMLDTGLSAGGAVSLPLKASSCETALLQSALTRADAHVSARSLEVGGAVRFGFAMRRLRMVAVSGRLILRLRTALYRSDWAGVEEVLQDYSLLPTEFGVGDCALAQDAAPSVAIEMKIASAHVVLMKSMEPLRKAIAQALHLTPLVSQSGTGSGVFKGALEEYADFDGAQWDAETERQRAAALDARAAQVERSARVRLVVQKGRARASHALYHATAVATAALRQLSPDVIESIAQSMPEQSQLVAIGTAVHVLHSALLEIAAASSASSEYSNAGAADTSGVRSALEKVCALVLRAAPFAAALRVWQRTGAIIDFERAQLWVDEQGAIVAARQEANGANRAIAMAEELRAEADAAGVAARAQERALRHELMLLLTEERSVLASAANEMATNAAAANAARVVSQRVLPSATYGVETDREWTGGSTAGVGNGGNSSSVHVNRHGSIAIASKRVEGEFVATRRTPSPKLSRGSSARRGTYVHIFVSPSPFNSHTHLARTHHLLAPRETNAGTTARTLLPR